MEIIEFRVINVPPSNVKERKVIILGYERLVDGVWSYMSASAYDAYLMQDASPAWFSGSPYAGLFNKRCQYTSKQDRNKKWIYDGDILTNGYHNAVVYWSEFSAQWIAENRKEYFIWNPEDFDLLEVIGNKYENEKLYEEIKDL